MTMLEEIYEAARQAAPSGTDETLLKRLGEIAAAQWEARLKDGVTAEDCGQAYVLGCAWLALAAMAVSWNQG